MRVLGVLAVDPKSQFRIWRTAASSIQILVTVSATPRLQLEKICMVEGFFER
jgi:hypothetical protein